MKSVVEIVRSRNSRQAGPLCTNLSRVPGETGRTVGRVRLITAPKRGYVTLQDLPTHVEIPYGFEILNGYREDGVPAASLLMDLDTYETYERFGTDTDAKGEPIKICRPSNSCEHRPVLWLSQPLTVASHNGQKTTRTQDKGQHWRADLAVPGGASHSPF